MTCVLSLLVIVYFSVYKLKGRGVHFLSAIVYFQTKMDENL